MTETVHGKYALEAPLCSTLGLTLHSSTIRESFQ